MKNKKAFTLIEIIACIAILSLISVIVLPKISGSNNKLEEYSKLVVTIENAAKLYYLDTDSTDSYVNISTLISEKYLDNTINPMTNTSMTGCVAVSIQDGVNVYTYNASCSFNFTVTFDANGGSVSVSTKTVTNGEEYGYLPTPTREDYTFLGWYTQMTGGARVDETSLLAVNNNHTLYAHWKYNKYIITFDANGGSVSTSSKEVLNGSTYGQLPVPIKEGSAFLGWYTDLLGSVLIYSNKTVDLSSNQVVYAMWEEVSYTYDYTGTIQSLVVPVSGYYKLEVWGAQGGTSSSISTAHGGYGGYSVGSIYLNENSVLYINAGGKGIDGNGSSSTKEGGYNGGGTKVSPDASYYSSSGGGATHIALSSGLLSSFSNDISNLIIVAGGGGGGAGISGNYGVGGSGGGFIGGSGTNYLNNYGWGSGGTQSEGGCKTNSTSSGYCGSFGLGNSTSSSHGGAGGGGYYGGGSTNSGNIGGGGGGSGYIGNSLLTNKVMYCYNCTESSDASTKTTSTTCTNSTATANCSKQGNGFAKITLLSGSYDTSKTLLIVNKNGLAVTQSFNKQYSPGEQIVLDTNFAYFGSWSVSGIGASINNNVLTIGEGITVLTANPSYTSALYLNYTGSMNCNGTVVSNTDCELQETTWYVKLLTSGTLTIRNSVTNVDIFLIGGGGGASDGSINNYSYGTKGAGGSGGKGVSYFNIVPTLNETVTVTIGAGGARYSSGGTTSVSGGNLNYSTIGGNGASGGTGGASVSGVGKGGNVSQAGGAGAYAFNDSSFDGIRYGAGGGGANGAGGSTGGGAGGGTSGANGTANTGSGGGGGNGWSESCTGSCYYNLNYPGGAGGSGIVILKSSSQ